MTWWILPIVLVTMAVDVLIDPDTRRAAWCALLGPPLMAVVEVLFMPSDRGGYRPRPSLTQKSPPQGTRGVPRKPGASARRLTEFVNDAKRSGGYQAKRKVNPKTIRPPRSGSAVVPTRPWMSEPDGWSGVADLTNERRLRPRPNRTRPRVDPHG